MTKMKIKKGDKVRVISGKDRGKEGVVLSVDPQNEKVVVEGVAIVKKAQRPTPSNQRGGIIEKEAAIHASNVMLLDPTTGEPTRIKRVRKDGKPVRISKKSNTEF